MMNDLDRYKVYVSNKVIDPLYDNNYRGYVPAFNQFVDRFDQLNLTNIEHENALRVHKYHISKHEVEITGLRRDIDELRQTNTELRQTNTELRQTNTELRRDIDELRQQNQAIFARLDKSAVL
ncbi:hypothetical protein EhV275 [Emiliania huxleyi virus 86]|uniref:Uncharacterized protein n=1 Tax=Emiliania huxleyi virus 86 (isolate United Kingdom/English Channel/1999) TaxID=654925 RepID=Q4A2K5_EHV8U|nr:hypothetical protein EhV275 [Emiliania huxleyi virus 86]AEO97726.1 hypothetical protein ENVG_00332 [Emiliania huxleyi virus 84]AEP15381.1 hypothetical protein EOVG_00444 [Emiliania huxleyi virus 88]AHA54884.1 hypothetical protein EhV145_00334 [Emiliania huxleyi virus 145]AHA55897.1 hypothetical protein EhV164_00310 [Emiliania huxleyi virus 164]CAI65701.1 hypothetical protein EhV275 [Emiliania huxleyi virus 86]